METQVRRFQNVDFHNQENITAKSKYAVVLPTKRSDVVVRGALGELNGNTRLQSQRDVNIVKDAVPSENEKKNLNRGILRSYKHVQSKVDTGLAVKAVVQPSSRPPLRREESTGRLAARAVVTRVALKDCHIKPNSLKDSINVLVQNKKVDQKKLPVLKENAKEAKSSVKSIIKEPIESLSKLKLAENESEAINRQIAKEPELPDDIEDIDANDNNAALQMSIYIKDIYKYLTHLEKKYPVEEDHLANQVVVTGRMRATLIDWLVDVQKQFSLELETFHLTVGIIDRYLQMAPYVQRNQLQLVGVTAMFIASKYEEVYPPDIADFVFIGDNAYSKSDVIKCETEILSKLGYCLARPIPLSFLRRFVKAAHGTSRNHHLAKYFVDLSLVEYSMAHYRPSELAAAAICLSLYLLSKKKLTEVWSATLSFYSGYTLEHIEPIMRKIAKIVTNVENSKHKAVYKKYLDPSLAKVSSLSQLKGETLRELAEEESS